MTSAPGSVMAHDRHTHDHGISVHTDLRWLTVALSINVVFMLVEVAGGAIASSLALLSDAAHTLTDAGAIALALVAARLARRRPEGAMTYGLGRAEILSAQANGITLLILSAFIAYEAIRRLIAPPNVEASLMLSIALAGIAFNLAAALALAKANRESLNVEGAFRHNVIDTYASIGTAVAAGVILLSGFDRADPLASLLIVLPMVLSGGKLLVASGRIFLEAAPAGLDPEQIGLTMAGQESVVEVHDLHVWEVTSGFPALSAHVTVAAAADCHQTRRRLELLLRDTFAISHSTLQVDHETDGLVRIEAPTPPAQTG